MTKVQIAYKTGLMILAKPEKQQFCCDQQHHQNRQTVTKLNKTLSLRAERSNPAIIRLAWIASLRSQ